MEKKTAGSKKSKRSDNLGRRAEGLLRKSPGRPEALPEEDLKGQIHDLQVHKIELEMQNEELRRAQVELEESRNRYFDLYELAPVGCLAIDRNGLILEANLTGASLLERERKYLKGRVFSRFVLDEDQKIFSSHMRGLFEEGTPQTCELRLIRGDDRTLYVRMESAPVRNGIGDLIHIWSALIDVTEQKQAGQSLRESKERFRLIAETSADIIFQLDPEGLILYCSPSVEKILGYTPANVEGTPLVNYILPYDARKARVNFQKLILGEKIRFFELDVLAKSGTSVPLEVNASPLVRDGELEHIFGISRDIRERRQIEAALKRREEHLRIAVEGGNLGTWERDLIIDQTAWNNILYNLLGRDQDRPITGETFFEYIHKDDLPRVREHLERAYGNEDKFIDEFRIIREDGEVRWMASSGRIYRYNKGRPILMAGVNLDITDRKNMELELHKHKDDLEMRIHERTKELQEANKTLRDEAARRKLYEDALKSSTEKILLESNRRRFLSGRLVETLERDRRDVAMYLHDQIGQMLATLKMDLEAIRKNPERANEPSNERLRQAEDKVGNLMGQVKDISRKLRPDILDTMGLVPALRALIETFESQFGLMAHFYYREFALKIDPDKSLSLYRITQEALTNVGKHAQATDVFVNLILKNNLLQLTVEDNGTGFDYDEMIKKAMGKSTLGIMIMRERAVLAGGELTVESEIGKGTHVTAEIPVG